MADKNKIIPFILSFEGGFSCNPLDRGGATNKGVTISTFSRYREFTGGEKPTVDDLKNISDDEWGNLFQLFFWDKIKGDDIKNQSIANMIMDWVWASGLHNPIRMVQRIVGSTEDGIVGKNTIKAINRYEDQKELFYRIKARRVLYIERVIDAHPELVVFKKGWIRRIDAIGYGSLKINK